MTPVTRCISSHLMTHLLVWRNPQGSDDRWFGLNQGITNPWKHLGKVTFVSISLSPLLSTSIIETAAYAVLTAASLALYPITHRPYTFFAKLLQSSSFTIIWGLFIVAHDNFRLINLVTQESLARLRRLSAYFCRLEDYLYISNWMNQHADNLARQHNQNNIVDQSLRELVAEVLLQKIDQGADFLREDVLSDATAETITLFQEMDPSIYMFILTKAIYIYAVGAKCNDAIPDFFKETTTALISILRAETKGDANTLELYQQLEQLIKDPAQFEAGPQEAHKVAFSRLRTIASEELQHSLLITNCWQKAAETLSAVNP